MQLIPMDLLIIQDRSCSQGIVFLKRSNAQLAVEMEAWFSVKLVLGLFGCPNLGEVFYLSGFLGVETFILM